MVPIHKIRPAHPIPYPVHICLRADWSKCISGNYPSTSVANSPTAIWLGPDSDIPRSVAVQPLAVPANQDRYHTAMPLRNATSPRSRFAVRRSKRAGRQIRAINCPSLPVLLHFPTFDHHVPRIGLCTISNSDSPNNPHHIFPGDFVPEEVSAFRDS